MDLIAQKDEANRADYLLEGKHHYHNRNIDIHCINMFRLDIAVHPLVHEYQVTGDDAARHNNYNYFDNFEIILPRDYHSFDF